MNERIGLLIVSLEDLLQPRKTLGDVLVATTRRDFAAAQAELEQAPLPAPQFDLFQGISAAARGIRARNEWSGAPPRFLSALINAFASIRSLTSGTSASTARRRIRYPSGRVIGPRHIDDEVNQTLINDIHATPPLAGHLGQGLALDTFRVERFGGAWRGIQGEAEFLRQGAGFLEEGVAQARLSEQI